MEAREAMRIVYACESGNQAWGMASADNDYDVRFIYAHRSEWRLSLEPGRDVIEQPINDDLDISGGICARRWRCSGGRIPPCWHGCNRQ